MGPKITLTHVLFALFAYLWYRSRDAYLQLVPPALPQQYFAYGNASTTCNVVIDDNTADELRYCEDMIEWDTGDSSDADRYLLLSCDPGRKGWNTIMGPLRDPSPRGDLWLYTYTGSSGSPRKLELEGYPASAYFHPLGIDIVRNPPNDNWRLFVLNHQKDNTTIEVFSLADPKTNPKAKHIKTLTHPSFVSPNSISAVSATTFYVSNDHTLTRRLPAPWGSILPIVETFLKYPRGWVDRVDIDESDDFALTVTRAASNIPFANGIALSPDGRTLAVASSSSPSILLYSRDATTNTLTYKSRVFIPFHPDNIAYSKDGSLNVAGHPHFPTLIMFSKDRRQIAPSWVVSLTAANTSIARREWGQRTARGPFVDTDAPFASHGRAPISSTHALKTLYQSDGTAYSSSSSAVFDKESGMFFVSGLYERGLLQCQVQNPHVA